MLAKLGVRGKLAAEELIEQWTVQFLSGLKGKVDPNTFKTVEQAIEDYLSEKRGTLDATATSGSSWLTITSSSGIGNGTISLTANSNTSTARMANITLPIKPSRSCGVDRQHLMIVDWMLENNLSTFTDTSTPYFTDVPSTDIYFKFVQKMRDGGFWTGCSATVYCERSAVTRDQMAPMTMTPLPPNRPAPAMSISFPPHGATV